MRSHFDTESTSLRAAAILSYRALVTFSFIHFDLHGAATACALSHECDNAAAPPSVAVANRCDQRIRGTGLIVNDRIPNQTKETPDIATSWHFPFQHSRV